MSPTPIVSLAKSFFFCSTMHVKQQVLWLHQGSTGSVNSASSLIFLSPDPYSRYLFSFPSFRFLGLLGSASSSFAPWLPWRAQVTSISNVTLSAWPCEAAGARGTGTSWTQYLEFSFWILTIRAHKPSHLPFQLLMVTSPYEFLY